jgi:hypothetical protein
MGKRLSGNQIAKGSMYVLGLALPALLIVHSSAVSRIVWLSHVAAFGLLITVVYAHHGATRLPSERTSTRSQIVGYLLLWSFPITLIASIFLLNHLLDEEFYIATAEIFLEYIEFIFPWITRVRYNYDLWPSSENGQILKSQVIVGLWFLYGLLISISFLLINFLNSSSELNDHKSIGFQKKSGGGIQLFFTIPFALLVSLATFFGWLDSGSADHNGKCLMNIRCYSKDDVTLLAAALLKMFGIFGFGFGAIIMMRKLIQVASKTT